MLFRYFVQIACLQDLLLDKRVRYGLERLRVFLEKLNRLVIAGIDYHLYFGIDHLGLALAVILMPRDLLADEDRHLLLPV